MKHIVTILMAAGMAMAVAACNGDSGQTTPQKEPTAQPRVGDDCQYKDHMGIEMKGKYFLQDGVISCGPAGGVVR